jgi:hypothetical protein
MRTHNIITFLALATFVAAGAAWSGPTEDYAAGDAAYRRGDVRGAIASLRKAADAGHARAQVLLGSILDASEQDEEAVRYLAMAAQQGDAEGMYLLAGMYSAGEGVARDPAKARELLEKSASLGHRESVFMIAAAYLSGGLGLSDAERSSPEALAWIRRAADGGHLPSLDRLAVAYRKGELGLPVDIKLAEQTEARARAVRGITAKPEPARRRPPVRMPGSG